MFVAASKNVFITNTRRRKRRRKIWEREWERDAINCHLLNSLSLSLAQLASVPADLCPSG